MLVDVVLLNTNWGGIRLIVGFQPLMVISPTASWIRWCMQVCACELMWTCLVWAERSAPGSLNTDRKSCMLNPIAPNPIDGSNSMP